MLVWHIIRLSMITAVVSMNELNPVTDGEIFDVSCRYGNLYKRQDCYDNCTCLSLRNGNNSYIPANIYQKEHGITHVSPMCITPGYTYKNYAQHLVLGKHQGPILSSGSA